MTMASRWKCWIMMSMTIVHCSGLPQNTDFEENAAPTIVTIDGYSHEEIEANTSTVIVHGKQCDSNEFKCHSSNGNCIRESWRCDGEDDCSDGSDEKHCFSNHQRGNACGLGDFMCSDASARCIRKAWRCDGEDDCADGSDEKNCYDENLYEPQCPSWQFMCQDGSRRCIRGGWRCDGEYDCMDGSDEKNCFNTRMTCPTGWFMCMDGSSRCIRGSWRCDGSEDCTDGSDEKNCAGTEFIQDNLPGNKSETQLFEDLTNTIKRLSTDQVDERARFFFGCTLAIKLRLSECLLQCNTIACPLQEMQNYLSACQSGNRQTCSSTCAQCGEANPRTGRRLGGDPNIGRTSNQTRGAGRILSGTAVTPRRKYPWMVELAQKTPDTFVCGGSIINNRWILTAANCLQDGTNCDDRYMASELKVVVGEHDRSTDTDNDADNTVEYDVERIVIHPDYFCRGRTNDFALLEVNRDIPFNNVIRPVCLPKDDKKTYARVQATVTGWGGATPTVFSNILNEAMFRIDPQDNCRNRGAVPSSQLCAGPVSGRGLCTGDRGGPLVVKEGNKYIQVGVASDLEANCNSASTAPSNIYSRVSKVLDWIKRTTATGRCK